MIDKIKIEERVLEISKMLLNGFTSSEICHNVSLKWNVSERQIQRYIRRCYNLWHRDFQKKIKSNFDYHLAKRGDLYKKVYEKENWNICLEIAKDEAKLMGIYPTEKYKVEIEEIIVKKPKEENINDSESGKS